jgi:acetylcholinesterase
MLLKSIYLCCRKPLENDTDWPTYTKEHPKYYILNAERNGIGKGPRTTACAFWNDFLPRLRNHLGEYPRQKKKSIPLLTTELYP